MGARCYGFAGGTMARTPGTAEQNERKRRRAIEMVLEEESTQSAAARALKVHLRTVQKWVGLFRRHGEEGITSKKASGRPKKLNGKQLKSLEKLLLQGPRARGYANDLWTAKRIVKLIHDVFGVHYHQNHIPRLLRSLGWTAQRPQREAVEKDPEKINDWIRVTWKRIKKKR